MNFSEACMGTVLVTGGGGFLGSHIIRRLLGDPEVGLKIISISRNPASHPDQEPQVQYEAGDISNEEQMQALFERIKPHVIIHSVSPHHLAPARQQNLVNVQGTEVLLRAAKLCPNTRAFIYTSSDAAILPSQEPITEDRATIYTFQNPSNPYGTSKGVAEALVTAANSPDLLTAALRIPGIYGEYDYDNMVPSLLSAIKKNEHKVQLGDNSRVFEVLDVRKAADAHLLAARALLDSDEHPTADLNPAGQVFFISDGAAVPYWDFFRWCYAAAGAPVRPEEVKVLPLFPLKILASTLEWAYYFCTLGMVQPSLRRQHMDHFERGCCWDIGKARRYLGYVPVSAEEREKTLKSMMDWGKTNLSIP